jgi:hypothetical protein
MKTYDRGGLGEGLERVLVSSCESKVAIVEDAVYPPHELLVVHLARWNFNHPWHRDRGELDPHRAKMLVSDLVVLLREGGWRE